MKNQNCAVTGANGYVGSRICAFLEKENGKVIRMSRKDGDLRFALGEPISADLFRKHEIKTLIHCAYDFSVRSREEIERVNVEGSIRLFESAKEGGVEQIIFISSMAAFDGCRSLYGQAKLRVEEEVERWGGLSLRPGLVHGSHSGGMVGMLESVISRSSWIPLIGSGKQVLYPVHEEDLCRSIQRVVQNRAELDSCFVVASEKGLSFREILRVLAERKKKKIRLLPIPWRLVWLGLKSFEVLGVKLGMRSDSVISLVNQDRSPDFQSSRKLGLSFRGF